MLDLFNLVLINPIINTLIAIYKLLLFINLPFAFGFSIIALTTLVRFLIYPITNAQIKSAKKMQELAPHMSRIKEQHKDNKTRQQTEMMQLYKEHNINPAAGCLPLLIQFPIFIALYNVFIKVISHDPTTTLAEINKVLYNPLLHLDKAWDPNFFGISLSATPLASLKIAPILLVVPVITAALQFIQSKMMTPKVADDAPKTKDDFAKAMQTQMTYFLPLMIGFFSFTFPVGLSLYWNTFTTFGIIQQYIINQKK